MPRTRQETKAEIQERNMARMQEQLAQLTQAMQALVAQRKTDPVIAHEEDDLADDVTDANPFAVLGGNRARAQQQFTFVIKHTSGVSNRVADALSRRHSLLSVLHVSVPGFSTFADLYPTDPFFGPIWTAVTAGSQTSYVIHDGFLFKDNRLCIPDCSLRLQLITELHNEGHIGRDPADSNRRRLVFREGDLVWAVLTRDRMPAHAYNKLKAKKIGPLEVLEHINDNAYRLRLPSDITTSDVFNVKYLSRYFPPDMPADSRTNPLHPGGPDAAAS
ncbi:hypothetical protein YC2023_067267 [Brassica napus]